MFLNYNSYSSLGKKISMTPSLRLVKILGDIIVLDPPKNIIVLKYTLFCGKSKF